jgi:DNA-binding transcriptional ArsR family regulator
LPKKPFRVISDPEIAKFLVDSAKRQILRYLAEKQLTQKMLAELLGMADPSVYYHLKELRQAGLIRVARTEPEGHGILQKFYEANATYFIADYAKMPLELRRYFIAVNLERLRGVFSILNALRGISISLSTEQMERLAERVAVVLVEVAKKEASSYNRSQAVERETLIMNLYGEALRRVIEESDDNFAGASGPLRERLSALGLLRLS